MAELDPSGLTPLDASGLTPVTRDAPRLDAGGLIPLDTSGLKPLTPERAGVLETAGLIGTQLLDTVTHHIPGSIAATLEGDEPFAERDWKDSLVERSRAKAAERTAEAGKGPTMIPGVGREDIAQLGQSMGFSAPPMVGGLAAGVGAGAVGSLATPAVGTAAGWTAGVGAAGALAYRASTNQFVRDLRDTVDADRKTKGQPAINDLDFNLKAQELAPLIREYGLWEAIPEAAGSALEFGVLKAPIKVGIGKIFGENIATRIATKAAALYGTELTTETITQQGQHNVEHAAGMKPGEQPRSWTSPGDLYESFKEVAPVTALQTTLMAGGFKGGQMLAARRNAAQPQPGDQSAVPAETILPPLDTSGLTPVSTGDVNPPGPPPPPGGPASPAVNPTIPPDGASAFEQAIQRPSAGVSTPGVTVPSPQPQESPPPAQGEAAGRLTLDAILKDPRTADEMRADIEKAKRDEEAARNWRPTAEWSLPPPGPNQYVAALMNIGMAEHKFDDDGNLLIRIKPLPGTRDAPVQLEQPADVHAGAELTAQPTPAQAEAGNYRKRHIEWNGLDIAIETEAGGQRTGISADGVPWSTTIQHPYGYIKGTQGRDGDQVDLYLGPHPQSPKVYVFDQIDPDSQKFDEHKLVIGARDENEAVAIYDAGFSDGSAMHRRGAITEMSPAELKTWLASGDTKKPLYYVKPRAPQPVKRNALSLFEFLAHGGGIRDDGGELRAMDLHKVFVPGFGRLVRSTGKRLDHARESAAEAGYLPDQQGTVRDLLDLLRHGNEVYSWPDRQAAAEREDTARHKADNEQLTATIQDARALAKEHGANLTDEELREAAVNSLVNGTDLIDEMVTIGEREIDADLDEATSYDNTEPQHAQVAAGAGEAGAGVAPPGEHAARPAAQPAAETAQEGGAGTGAQLAGNEPRPAAPAGEPAQGVEPKKSAIFGPDGAQGFVRATTGDEKTFGKFRAFLQREKPWNSVDAYGDTPKEARDKAAAKLGEKLDGSANQSVANQEAPKPGSSETGWEDFPGGVRPTEYMGRPVPDNAKPWKLAKAGDTLVTGDIVVARKIDRKARAQEIAASEGGRLSLDGPRAWAVIKSPNAKPRTPSVPTKTSEQTEATPEAGPLSNLPAVDLVNALLRRLLSGKPITAQILQQEAAKAYGAKLSEGKFNRKDAHDALELAVNFYIKETRHLRVDSPNPQHAIKMLSDVLDELPTQRVRDDEQVAFDQFSTPPNYAAAVVYAANLKNGDTLLEPTAGTGSIVAAASMPGVKIIANELSERRVALLRVLIGSRGQVFNENAEQIDNILDVKPTVVVMNPPFSSAAGRMGDKKVPMLAAQHIETALNLLQPGGRLVAIVGGGMTMGAPTYRAWWSKIGKDNNVVANIGVAGKVFEKYGTTFGTRVLVIDKVAPSGKSPILSEAQTVDDLMRALEPIHDGRPEPQSRADQSGSAAVADAGESRRPSPSHAPTQSGELGAGERGDGRVAGDREPGVAEPGGQPVRVESGERDGVAADQPGGAGPERAGGNAVRGAPPGGKPEAGRSAGAQRNLEPAAKPEPGAAAGGERVELETHAAPGTQAATDEISESLYQPYEPARVRVKGAKPHPGPLVESASMSSVNPPPATYQPNLPKHVIDNGELSLAQLETTVYAGQAHSKMLPGAEGQPAQRRGYFIGDGTGVGKGREIAGIILDNWQQGRTKAIWVSEKKKLLNDAQRDWKGLGQNPNVIFSVGKVKAGEPVTAGKGIGFITYDTLKGGMSDQAALARGSFVKKQSVKVNGQRGTVQRVEPGRRGEPGDVVVNLDNGTQVTVKAHEVTAVGAANVKSRVDQIVDWVGPDFDGVIAFDEAHNMGNATSEKGERGMKDAAQKAIAGIELQKRLPNARVVYVSATGATEVSNLAYAERLGLWGRGTAFASQAKFVSEVAGGGIAAMELIARDMKQLGLYTARNLSYDGVEYQRVEHKLDQNQREIYDTLAEAWQVVLRNINAALEETGGNKDGRAKAAAMSAFWGGHQRFFNQIVTSLQMPSVITAVEKDLAEGRQVVLQLTNTNEASQERAAAKAETAEQIEDLDITPRDQIIQLIEKSFPTQEYEQYVDSNGKKRSRPVTDKNGNPVQNKKAVAMREALIDRLASIRVPQGPLDMILDHFGTDVVAEVTGRGRRFVMKTDEKTGERRRVEESRPASANQAEIDSFQGAKKKILVFSDAGGTGASYHADNDAPSKNARRAHYLLQGGWRADKAVQGLGRSHRTNQASAPIVSLVTTDLQGQKRFISSIARRLGQLGALTKGARAAGDQGIFSARDNLESTEARQALSLFFTDLLAGKVEGIRIDQFEQQTGLKLRSVDEEGRENKKQEMPPITQFLNRLLSLKIEMQNAVFEAFSERLDAVIEARRQAGLLDVGLETVKADKITKDSEQVVHSIEGVGAETKHVKLTVADKFTPIDFDNVVARGKETSHKLLFFARSPNNKVYAVFEAPSLMDAKAGTIIDSYRIINPVSGGRVIARKNIDQSQGKWTKIDKAGAQKLWEQETEKAPEFVTRDMHLITGAILPIWDRLKGSTRVVRLQTDSGERFLGRVVPNGQIGATLKALGAEAATSKIEPDALFQKLMAGGRATLANGWSLSRRLVAGEHRIELKGPTSFSEGQEVKNDGVFTERIAYEVRYFVPTDEVQGWKVLQKLIQYRPVVDMSDAGVKAGEATATDDDEGMFSLGHDEPAYKTGTGTEVRVPFTEKFAEHAEAVYPILRAELDRLGLKSVGLKLADEIRLWQEGRTGGTAAGVFYQNLITLALSGERKFAILHHEALHALRRLGAFTENEWAILTRASNGTWRSKFGIDEKYQGWPEWVQQEEGITHAYEAWIDGKLKVEGRIARLFKRIKDMLEAIGNAFRGHGFKTAESIFSDVARGTIGERATSGIPSKDIPKGKVAYAINSADGDLFKTEIVETPDGPRQQSVIPGAEKITDKERAQRGADKPLQPKKPQKGPGGLFDEPDTQMPLFAAAWHGSPHQFEQFTTGKIGTGEGAQAYGWGLYFAGKEDVARFYRDKLSSPYNASTEAIQAAAGDAVTIDAERAATIRSFAADKALHIESAARRLQWRHSELRDESGTTGKGPKYDALLRAVEHVRQIGKGRLFKVNINTEIEHMLDWDKPMSQQSDHVRKALAGLDSEMVKIWRTNGAWDPGITGKILYGQMARDLGGERMGGPKDKPALQYPLRYTDEKAASLKLHEIGIPGIRYLDQGSRTAGVPTKTTHPTQGEMWTAYGTGAPYFKTKAEVQQWLDEQASHNYVVFDERLVEIEAMFSLAQEPQTVVEGQRVMQGFLARGQFIDRAIRMPFDWFGGVTRDGQWKRGLKLHDKASKLIVNATFKPEGAFGFLNPFMETARSGLIDRYNLRDMPEYVTRERERALDERAVMMQGAEVLQSLKDHAVGPAEAKVIQAILTGEDVSNADMGKLAEPIRAAIDQLGQEAVALGMVSAESFERNRGTYLHRVYLKYEAEQHGLSRMVNGIMASRRKKLIGDQYRGRGMFQDIDLARLMRDVPDWHDGARGKPANGEKFIRLDEMPDQAQLGLDEKATPEKAIRTVYWPADRAIPDRYSGFTNQGAWEVRGEKGGKLTIWRDFTKAEREKMGEILDARYTIGKTFMLMAHDLSVGKFYKDIAENESWAMSHQPNSKWVDAAEWQAQHQRHFKHGDIAWVKVPGTEIPNSGGKKRWGALAGKYVREEIWRDLNELDIMSRPGTWRALLTWWKLNKTARSPIVHMNNVMSNFVLMDLMDVRFQDLIGGIKSFVNKDAHYDEAFQNGAFGADMMSQEVRDQVLKPILEEIAKQGAPAGGRLGAMGQVSKFTELLWSKLKMLDQKMIDVYRVEDELFRMATYLRRRELGDSPKEAANVAREQFIDYDIRAPWVNAARNTVLPFISYTYRAIPLVAKMVATRPWKIAKYALLGYALNAMAYALSGGDEDKERRSLREQEQGHTWIGADRMARMPWNDKEGNPVFLDIRRWMPAGDVFDFNQGQMALPVVPAWLNIGGPLMLGGEFFLNKQAFTGREITNDKTDDIYDKAGKVGDWAWKSLMPNAPWVPGSWSNQKIEDASQGVRERYTDRPINPTQAVAASVGIKLKPEDVARNFERKGREFKKVDEALAIEARNIEMDHDRGALSDAAYNRAKAAIEKKRERNSTKAAETLR